MRVWCVWVWECGCGGWVRMLECESGVCLGVGGYVGGCASTMYVGT